MKGSFKDAIEHRRSYYAITNISPVSGDKIQDILEFAVLNVPSAFNSQTTRVVLLLADSHLKLWDITMQSLRKIVPATNLPTTEKKINSFAAGYGTVLYFEDQEIVHNLQKQFPPYANNFPVWSEHTSAMHQFTIWTMLEAEGFGASLQHYNELIDVQVREEWKLPDTWKLIAQMPFGKPTAEPAEKSFMPIKERVLLFR